VSQPTDARNLQTRIADHIRAQIETGQLKPGQQLPSITDLVLDYKCSDGTVRAALELLKQQGLVTIRQGKGSYVRERPKARRHGIGRYSRSVWSQGTSILTAEAAQQGLSGSQLIRFIGKEPAPPEVAERLGIKPRTRVHVRKRTTIIEDRFNQLADSYYPLDVVDAAPLLKEEDTGPGGGYARIEEAGIRLAEIQEEISVRMPTSPETVALELPEGTPVVDLLRTTYDDTGRAVEVMVAVIAGDMVTFENRFPIPE
jgi:GntR family transcriptional regulator